MMNDCMKFCILYVMHGNKNLFIVIVIVNLQC